MNDIAFQAKRGSQTMSGRAMPNFPFIRFADALAGFFFGGLSGGVGCAGAVGAYAGEWIFEWSSECLKFA